MEGQISFSSFSYFTGVLTGMVIRWTDIVPICGGFVLGLTFSRPGVLEMLGLPTNLADIASFVKRIAYSKKSDDPKK
jgi:hypothetical protein